jgi:pilus assembly protein CpaC
MYDNHFARTRTALTGATGSASAFPCLNTQRRPNRRTAHWHSQWHTLIAVLAIVCAGGWQPSARAQDFQSPSLVRKISGVSDKMELITNTSRILTLDKNIPRVQVNNPELLAVTPLSANQIQVSAKKAGVTQVNLWDEDGQIHTVDVLIYGDARELEIALQVQFPNSTIKVYRYSESLVLKGFVDRPDYVSQIMRLAEDYAPKVINNITVGGVQQVLLKVKVMEVSRTKLRDLGWDWAVLNGGSVLAASNVSGLLQPGGLLTTGGGAFAKVGGPVGNGGQTFQFGVFNGNDRFLAFLNALQECRLARTLAEPSINTVSGRPAQFQVGGEFPILIPQSLGTTSIEFKPYGTQVDFLPIVLGNGNIRLEVRPRISDIDPTLSVNLLGSFVPALTVRQIDTAVEMRAGQTFALGGLIQERTETLNTGLPYVSDMPIIGVPFRRTRDKVNEIELLVLVTPEFVDAMDPGEVPCDGPGYASTSPNNHDLYCSGHVEVPLQCYPTRGLRSCGDDSCNGGQGAGCNCGGNGGHGGNGAVITDGMNMPGGVGYENESHGPTMVTDQAPNETGPTPAPGAPSLPSGQSSPVVPDDLPMPPGGAAPPAESPSGASIMQPSDSYTAQPGVQGGLPRYTAPRPYSPPRQPVFMRNAANPNNRQPSDSSAPSGTSENGLIGPVGYDVQ